MKKMLIIAILFYACNKEELKKVTTIEPSIVLNEFAFTNDRFTNKSVEVSNVNKGFDTTSVVNGQFSYVVMDSKIALTIFNISSSLGCDSSTIVALQIDSCYADSYYYSGTKIYKRGFTVNKLKVNVTKIGTTIDGNYSGNMYSYDYKDSINIVGKFSIIKR